MIKLNYCQFDYETSKVSPKLIPRMTKALTNANKVSGFPSCDCDSMLRIMHWSIFRSTLLRPRWTGGQWYHFLAAASIYILKTKIKITKINNSLINLIKILLFFNSWSIYKTFFPNKRIVISNGKYLVWKSSKTEPTAVCFHVVVDENFTKSCDLVSNIF